VSSASPPQAYDGFAIDLDGVVWLSHEPIGGSVQAIERLRRGGRPVVFVTNDPRSTRDELARKLAAIGAPSDAAQILTSASATAQSLAAAAPGARVLAVGTESLRRELAECGLEPLAPGDPGEVVAVVIGGGSRFDYEVLRIAADAVRGGAELWATNKDPTYPTAAGLVPGTGAIVAAIETASGVQARNIGKPERALFDAARERLGCERPLMIGDSLHSDVAGAAAAGMATALVLTGRDSREDVGRAPQAPDLIFASLEELALTLA
jgi:4-nitrophenyl phosphatase